ncbi:hypothetical protein NBRC116495_21410 [Aurantivibrio plasticivorans]
MERALNDILLKQDKKCFYKGRIGADFGDDRHAKPYRIRLFTTQQLLTRKISRTQAKMLKHLHKPLL